MSVTASRCAPSHPLFSGKLNNGHHAMVTSSCGANIVNIIIITKVYKKVTSTHVLSSLPDQETMAHVSPSNFSLMPPREC